MRGLLSGTCAASVMQQATAICVQVVEAGDLCDRLASQVLLPKDAMVDEECGLNAYVRCGRLLPAPCSAVCCESLRAAFFQSGETTFMQFC